MAKKNKAKCVKCLTEDPEPCVEDDIGKTIYWFCIQEDGSLVQTGVMEDGEIGYAFIGCDEIDPNLEDHIQLICPNCVSDIIEEDEDGDIYNIEF